ncbi:MAG TPA: phytanoyl-CoA dioxygenase family protein [Polyangiales bacterium]|nr:phytanoyl-CoA dioxygenase family protein [Polyangiales bacterium]
MNFRYELEGEPVDVVVEGQTIRGDARVLLGEDDDLTQGRPWAERGFVVAPFLAPSSYRDLVEGVRARLASSLREAGAVVPADIQLTDYHHYIQSSDMHLRALRDARSGYSLREFPIALEEVTSRVSELLGLRVTPYNQLHGLDKWHVRVIRPASRDHNPLHRDVWLDRLRNAVNIYVPLAGSTRDSALPLVPGSHRWPESELLRTAQGATVDGISYTVPAVVGSDRPLRLVRPTPREDELLLFSPYLVHGGAKNRGDVTRCSLEMRFWRAS